MKHVKLADAKARLSELVDRAEAGEQIDIVRRGKLAARLIPPVTDKVRVDVAALRAVAANLPRQATAAAQTVRAMRESDRY